jgi:MOSC domain-containing protein YiiM
VNLVSVNVGLPRQVRWKGKTVTTGIFKTPVEGPVPLHLHNLEGDRQADLSVHGGPSKAVYVYPTQHYDYWRVELANRELPWGIFGENFTVDSGDEETIHIGDEFVVGSAHVVVTEPRLPCYKLGIRFQRSDMEKMFLNSGRTGFYLAVRKEGIVQAGDQLRQVVKHPDGLTVADVTRLYTTERTNEILLRKAISVNALPEKWRHRFQHQLESLRK